MKVKGPIEERRMYKLIKYNFRTATGESIEEYPKKIKGLSNAIRLIEHLETQLTPEEREAGIRWYHQP
jgi:hypothetical protein